MLYEARRRRELRFRQQDESVVISNGDAERRWAEGSHGDAGEERTMRTLSTEEISKSYGGRQVVRGVSLKD